MNFSLKKIVQYCTQYSTPPSKLLVHLDRETHLRTLAPQMISGPLQGQFLRLVSKLVQPQRILEIGTFTGYSALCMVDGLAQGGSLVTIEANEEVAFWARKYIAKSEKADQIELIVGDAKQILPKLVPFFDMILIDAGKMDYAWYYDHCIPLLRSGGVLLADNVLWSGKVVQQGHDNDTAIIHAFNQKVAQDDRVENVILPLRDGLTLVRKR